jgi:hypothetical protein
MSRSAMRPWIVVPAYNEALSIAAVVGGARRHAPVLVVDDGSTDATAAEAQRAGAEVVRHGRRLGKGQALRSGFVAARVRGADVIVTVDGDGQHDPEDIPGLLAAALAAPDAIIVGGRLRPHAPLPAGRLNAIRVAGFFLTWVTGRRLDDTQSGFRAYPAALFETVVLRRGGFVLETEVLVAAAAHGVPVREVPIAVRPRVGQRSRFRPVVDGAAIAAYLAGRSLARWAHEGAAAGRTVASIFHGDRLAARHAAMLEAGRAHESPGLAAAAAGAVAGQRALDRLAHWWQHPRRRRASAAASGMLAAPVLLVLAAAQTMAGRRGPDLVTPLVERLYAPDRLQVTPSESGRTLTAPSALP